MRRLTVLVAALLLVGTVAYAQQGGIVLESGEHVPSYAEFQALQERVAELEGTETPDEPPPEEPSGDVVTAEVVEVTASSHDGNVPTNTIDGDLGTRWSASGEQWIVWQLDGLYTLDQARIAQHAGDNGNQAVFTLDVSTDGTTWTTVHDTVSTGTTAEFEAYAFDHDARYVRYSGSGRETSPWNSLTEVEFDGVLISTDPAPDPPAEPDEPVGEVAHGTDLTLAHVGITSDLDDLQDSGPVTSTHDGQVIEDLHITASGRGAWGVTVAHDDVTVRNVWIDHPNGGQGLDIDGDRYLIEHVTTDVVYLAEDRQGHQAGSNNVGHRSAELGGNDGVFRRNHMVRARSAVKIGGNDSIIVENYVEDLFNRDEPIYGPSGETRDWKLHGTAFANSSGNNRNVIARNVYRSGDSGGITLYSSDGPITDYLIANNHAIGDGEGFPIIGGHTHTDREGIHDIRIEGNRFSGVFGFPSSVGDGTNAAVHLGKPGNTFDNNRWVGSDRDLPARCGWQQDSCQ